MKIHERFKDKGVFTILRETMPDYYTKIFATTDSMIIDIDFNATYCDREYLYDDFTDQQLGLLLWYRFYDVWRSYIECPDWNNVKNQTTKTTQSRQGGSDTNHDSDNLNSVFAFNNDTKQPSKEDTNGTKTSEKHTEAFTRLVEYSGRNGGDAFGDYNSFVKIKSNAKNRIYRDIIKVVALPIYN